MGARRGAEVLQKLREQPMEIWHRGRRVEDMTTEPGFANGAASLAELYDVQWEDPETMLFDSPTSGDKVGRSFMTPKTKEELMSVGAMMQRWAGHTFGMMGRAPDYLNRAISAYAGGADFVCLGMFDFQVQEDVALAVKTIAESKNRKRQWF